MREAFLRRIISPLGVRGNTPHGRGYRIDTAGLAGEPQWTWCWLALSVLYGWGKKPECTASMMAESFERGTRTSAFSRFRYQGQIRPKVQLLRLLWGIIWAIGFRFTPRWALHGWRRFLLRLFGAKVGCGCRIDPTCFVWAPWNLQMGDYVALAAEVDCYNVDRIVVGSKVTVSQRTFLCTASHDVHHLQRPLTTAPIRIGDHCWIAAECMILPGVTVSDGAVIGARSLVTKDMPAWTICAGHPCKPIKARELSS